MAGGRNFKDNVPIMCNAAEVGPCTDLVARWRPGDHCRSVQAFNAPGVGVCGPQPRSCLQRVMPLCECILCGYIQSCLCCEVVCCALHFVVRHISLPLAHCVLCHSLPVQAYVCGQPSTSTIREGYVLQTAHQRHSGGFELWSPWLTQLLWCGSIQYLSIAGQLMRVQRPPYSNF
jgi:hypothetical protein